MPTDAFKMGFEDGRQIRKSMSELLLPVIETMDSRVIHIDVDLPLMLEPLARAQFKRLYMEGLRAALAVEEPTAQPIQIFPERPPFADTRALPIRMDPVKPADCDADAPSLYWSNDGTGRWLCRCGICARCNKHTGNSHQGHYWSYCRVTKQAEKFHFCCPGDCELEAERK